VPPGHGCARDHDTREKKRELTVADFLDHVAFDAECDSLGENERRDLGHRCKACRVATSPFAVDCGVSSTIWSERDLG
jgi:hypothetical protein